MSRLPDELAFVAGHRWKVFREKFGRDPDCSDPLFFDPDAATPIVIGKTMFEAQMRETCDAINVPFEKVTNLLEGDVMRSARFLRPYWLFLEQFKPITGMSGVEAQAYIETLQQAEDELYKDPNIERWENKVNELADKLQIAVGGDKDDIDDAGHKHYH